MEKDKILETVVDNLDYIVQKDILVKPLDKIKFKKKVSEPVATGKKDKEGSPKYEIKEVEKEVASEFTLGIIIAMPAIEEIRKGLTYKEGDTNRISCTTHTFVVLLDCGMACPQRIILFQELHSYIQSG